MTLIYDKINEFGRREVCFTVDTPDKPKIVEAPKKRSKQTKLFITQQTKSAKP